MRIHLASALAAVLLSFGVSVALGAPAQAQTTPAGCADSLLALTKAEGELKQPQGNALAAREDANTVQKSADTAQADDNALTAAEKARDKAKAELDALPETADKKAAQEELTAAVQAVAVAEGVARQTDTQDLQKTADRKDGEADAAEARVVPLQAAVDTARKAADSSCQGAKGADAVYFASCTEARDAGAAPINVGKPGYRVGLDADRDGVACEASEAGGTDPSAGGSAGGSSGGSPSGTNYSQVNQAPVGGVATGEL